MRQFISVAFRDSPLDSYDVTACAGEGGDEGGNEVVGGDTPLEWFASVTHRVRASAQVESKFLVGFYLCSLLPHFIRPFTSYIVRPLNDSILPPNQTHLIATTGPTPESPHGTLLDKFGRLLVSLIITPSTILQLYFNHHLWSFTCVYKVCVGVELLVKVCLVFGPGGVWKLEVRDVIWGRLWV